jgi:Deacetylase PdaC/Protein of unknown function (DUF3298)
MRISPTVATSSIIGLLVFFSLGYWYITSKSDGYLPPPPYSAQPASPYSARSVRISHETDFATASGSYPQFDKASASFNKSIEDTIDKAIAEHAITSEENWKARWENSSPQERKELTAIPKKSERFAFFVEWSAHASDEQHASVALHFGGFSGGAHGSSSIETFTYDYTTKKTLTLKDLFPKHPQYLKKISTEARLQLAGILAKKAGSQQGDIDMEFLNAGTEPTDQNFARFTINTDRSTVRLYFTTYQVAAYVFGEQEIELALPSLTTTPAWIK